VLKQASWNGKQDDKRNHNISGTYFNTNMCTFSYVNIFWKQQKGLDTQVITEKILGNPRELKLKNANGTGFHSQTPSTIRDRKSKRNSHINIFLHIL